MSVIGSNILSGASGQATGYDLEQSLRFNDADNAYLKRTISSGNRKTWTWSGWVKKSTLATGHGIFGTETSGTAEFFIMQWTGGGSGDSIFIQGYTNSAETTRLLTTRKFKDPSAWYHIVLAVDTTQATASNRLKLYVNGEQITDFASGSQVYPNSQNLGTAINNAAYPLMVGAYSTGTPDTLDGYLSEVHFVDGLALAPTEFGETNSVTNQWIPIEVTGLTYGNNGFYLPFSGTDSPTAITDSTKYTVQSFTSSTTWTAPSGVTSVEYLVVAGGGGGGGGYYGGGGGAGGLRTGTLSVTPAQSYTVTIGAGGAGTGSANTSGSDGSASVFSSITSAGGGGGGGSGLTGRNGGSGGGGGGNATTSGGSASPAGQGTAGGAGIASRSGGGGGGAGAVGNAGDNGGRKGGVGGAGLQSNITGTNTYYAGGGGGGSYNQPGGTGGAGGGGTGDFLNPGGSGTANTGGGGGGASVGGNPSGAGGSGIVVVRYLNTAGTVSRHTVTANGHTKKIRGDNLNGSGKNVVALTSGSGNWNCPVGVTSVEVLVVAAGGGGGGLGGGGGAGGVVHHTSKSVTAGNNYAYSIGTGGTGNSYNGGVAGSGANTTFDNITAVGGGGGSGQSPAGSAGGSGGGGNGGYASAGGSGTQADSGGGTGYGNNGGAGFGGDYFGGGGGGAGAAGGAGNSPTGKTGAGGDGRYFATFKNYGDGGYFGGGGAGGGGTSTSTGVAGIGGGGTGSCGGAGAGRGEDGTANTGGGGGGGANETSSNERGGNGGTGVVLIAWSYDKGDDSSIKFDGTGDYLSVADSSDWSFGTGNFTLETWVRFNDSAGSENLFSQYQDSSHRWYLSADLTNNKLSFYDAGSSMDVEQTVVTWVENTWYHVAMVRNSGTVTYYVNGTAYTITGTNPNGNITSNTGALQIGRYNTGDDLNGYMSDIRISNSARYTSAFTPNTAAFTADANTKLLISADGFTGLGSDSSGNYNYFTPTNVGTQDQVLDSPTNNFCTLNPLDGFNSMTATEGNLRANTNSGSDPKINATFQIPQSGKWYWEFVDQHGLSIMVGVIDQINSGNIYGNNNSAIYSSGLGTKYNFSSVSSYGASWTTGDIIGVAINRDDNEITFYKNNSSQGTFTIGGTVAQRARLIPVIGTGTGGTGGGTFNFGQDSSFHGTKTAQGNSDGNDNGDFYYAPPTGYLALCTNNLSDPSIELPGDHFNTVLYTGTGSSATNAITGVGFTPDLIWLKDRSTTTHHGVFDTIRGTGQRLITNSNGGEDTQASMLSAFGTDGFTTSDHHNTVNNSHVAWTWKAGGTPTATNSAGAGNTPTAGSVKINGSNLGSALAGTIQAIELSANTEAGFSMVKFAGTSSQTNTVAHGLSQAPEMIIVKGTSSTQEWSVWHDVFPVDSVIYLDSSGAAGLGNNNGRFDVLPTASVFTPGDAQNTGANGVTYISYCFHSVEGYSKVGSYEGNANADGTFAYTGFRPAFVMVKNVDTGGINWYIQDNKRASYNPVEAIIAPNTNGAEFNNGTDWMDFTSNGFKLRYNGDPYNAAATYIYLAFAESPFQTSNAR